MRGGPGAGRATDAHQRSSPGRGALHSAAIELAQMPRAALRYSVHLCDNAGQQSCALSAAAAAAAPWTHPLRCPCAHRPCRRGRRGWCAAAARRSVSGGEVSSHGAACELRKAHRQQEERARERRAQVSVRGSGHPGVGGERGHRLLHPPRHVQHVPLGEVAEQAAGADDAIFQLLGQGLRLPSRSAAGRRALPASPLSRRG